jgi:hypothetical protein
MRLQVAPSAYSAHHRLTRNEEERIIALNSTASSRLEAYGRAPGQALRPPPPPRFQFIVAVDDSLVVVHGKTGTATAQLVYTEYVREKQGEQARHFHSSCAVPMVAASTGR